MLINSNSIDSDSFLGHSIKLETLISEGYIYPIKDPSTNGGKYDQTYTTVEISKTGDLYKYKVTIVKDGSEGKDPYISADKDVYALTREDITIP